MTSRLTSMQAQFRRRQEDEKEHKLLQQGHSGKQPGAGVSTSALSATQRNGFLPSTKNKTAPAPSRTGPGIRTGSATAPRPVPSALRPATTISATKPTTIVHKITLTGTNSSARVAVNNANASANAPRMGLDRSATYSKPTVAVPTPTSGSVLQNRNRRCDENGNELTTSNAAAAGRIVRNGGSKLQTRPTHQPVTAAAPSSADLTKRLAGLNLGERKVPAPKPVRAPPIAAALSRRPLTTSSPAFASASRPRPASASAPARQRQPLSAKKTSPPPGTVPCSQCGRHFASDRVEKHETICKKTAAKKRKVFDPTKMRMKGTEAEPYLKVVVAATRPGKAASAGATGAAKSNWRKKHEDFIRTIRLAKEYNAHVAAGGNPADLPPPPPSDYSDYVQCPHCGRKFNEAVASRHIPKCSNIKSNKR